MFGKKKRIIAIPNFDGCDKSFNDVVFSQISRGNLRINYLTIRRYCDSNFSADIIARNLCITNGFEIEFEGKIYKEWF